MLSYILALLAALIWSTNSIIATRSARFFGSYNFNFLRLFGIIIIFFPYVYLNWSFQYFQQNIFFAIAASSIIGILIGDTFLYICLKRLGPRRQSLLFSLQIPFTIFFSHIFLNSLPSIAELIGCALVFSGIIIAIQFNRTIEDDDLENIQGNRFVGLFAGIGLAICQAIGIIIMKPILTDTDPIIVSYIRVIISALAMFATLIFIKNNDLWSKIKNVRQTSIGLLSGFFGMGVGMTMLIIALKNGNPGIVSTLSSTMPIMVIPILWFYTKNYAGHLSVLGAFASCVGVAIIFIA